MTQTEQPSQSHSAHASAGPAQPPPALAPVTLDFRSIAEERAQELSQREAALAEANAALSQREAALCYQADLLAHVHDAVVATDPGSCITAWNHASEQLFGWQEAEVLGRPLAEVLPMQAVGATGRGILAQIDETGNWRGEVVTRHRDGTAIHMEATAVALRDGEGRVVGRVAVNRDISERKQAEEQVRRQAERAQALVRTAERLNGQLQLQAVLDAVCEEAAQALHVAAAWINLYHAAHDALEYAASRGMPPEFGARYTPSPKPLLDDYAGRMGRILVFPDVQELKDIPNARLYAALNIRTVANATMQHEGQLVGVLSVVSFGQIRYFSEDELLLLQGLAHQAALAIANARLFAEVRSGRTQLRTLSHHLVAIQEDERKKLSRELHDRAGQSMTSLKLRLALLRRSAGDFPALQAQVDELRDMADTVMEDLHELAVNLRPSALDRSGLVPALEQLVQAFQRQQCVSAELLVSGWPAGRADQARLPEDVETALYRIAQEALTNVARHAQARRAGVILQRHAERVILIVEDDGRGFDVDDALLRGRLGLLGMRERAEMVGGTLTIESAPGTRTTVYVEVPLRGSLEAGVG